MKTYVTLAVEKGTGRKSMNCYSMQFGITIKKHIVKEDCIY